MAGPAVGLWLSEARAFGDVLAEVVPWLERFCEPVESRGDGGLDFWVRDGSAVGLPAWDPADGAVFFLAEDEEVPAEDEDHSAFPQPPVQGLVLGAGRSGPANHRMLGHLALALAERLGALIDFDGVLGYRVPHDGVHDGAALERARALVASLPGEVAEVGYDTGDGGRWFRHVGDVRFLRAWLRHPEFHL
ncbi:hypothetical protein LRR80_01781 [Streptomyces sp. RO-S4]|uniref:DUF6368 family protein n=1 Tax=unclassified Streptomyces TaxID=2593676 RepID=UPI001E612D60|nr:MULTISPECIES: DUF6368 family protein [unclassified Streptomyces]MCO4695730.1 hypothetical protein [Streptomyces sp. RO-S4]